MTKHLVFVDGQEGTTGLKIHERLATRDDLEILRIDPEHRKEPQARRALLNEADIAFLCLPDDAARESVSLVENDHTRIIDASTAHRTAAGWVYGLPELRPEQRSLIRDSRRVSVPGCHATGFNLMLHPLVREGIVPADYPLTCWSVAGYSGGGRSLISRYETEGRDRSEGRAARPYALSLGHKHVPEMQHVAGLSDPPIFTPIVGDFYQGEIVSIPLFQRLLAKKLTAAEIREFLESYYASEPLVRVLPFDPDAQLDDGLLDATPCNRTNMVEILVFGRNGRILVCSRFDNLGKGSSGAAVQNMNIMLGIDESMGLQPEAAAM